jgi:phosphoglycerol transferase MdoB-like AlkP superfamily enzyme
MLSRMSISTLEQVQSGYYMFFQLLYPLIHNHLASYLIFLLILLSAAYAVWKAIRNKKRRVFSRFLLGAVGLFLLSYIIWFIVFHFYTFQNL